MAEPEQDYDKMMAEQAKKLLEKSAQKGVAPKKQPLIKKEVISLYFFDNFMYFSTILEKNLRFWRLLFTKGLGKRRSRGKEVRLLRKFSISAMYI